MLTDYIQAAMREAHYELMEDGRFFAVIPSCVGLWADGNTLEGTREQLKEVLEDWILIKARHGDEFPIIAGDGYHTTSDMTASPLILLR